MDEAIVPAGEDLAFAGVAGLSGLLRAGEVTPRELVGLYLARIERLDPVLGAFVSVRPQAALAEADAALERLRAGEPGAGGAGGGQGQRRQGWRGDRSR